MFICSLRPKAIVKKLLFLAVIVAAIFLLLTLLKISSRQENDPGSTPQASQTHETEAPNNLARITFLKSYGWEVSEEPSEVVSVVIPQTFGDVYENYNAIRSARSFKSGTEKAGASAPLRRSAPRWAAPWGWATSSAWELHWPWAARAASSGCGSAPFWA